MPRYYFTLGTVGLALGLLFLASPHFKCDCNTPTDTNLSSLRKISGRCQNHNAKTNTENYL